jgi:flagellar biosynthesis protein FlhB
LKIFDSTGKISLVETGVNLMKKWTSKKTRWIVGLIMAFFFIVVLPFMSWLFLHQIGVSEQPDVTFFYPKEYLFDLASLYGSEGIKLYIILRYTFDLIWPVVYTVFLFVFITYYYKNSRFYSFAIASVVLSVFFDLCENIGATIVFAKFPSRLEGVALFTSVSSTLKWGFLIIAFTFLVAGIVAKLWKNHITRVKA